MGDTDTDSWLTEAVAEGVETVRESAKYRFETYIYDDDG